MTNQIPESILSKIHKLYNLYKCGQVNEAANAKRILDTLLTKYNVTIEQITKPTEKEYHFHLKHSKYAIEIFIQCYCYIKNVSKISYKQSYNDIWVTLTESEYIDLNELYTWHYNNFVNEIEAQKRLIFKAYCRKHELWNRTSTKEDTGECKMPTPEEIREMMAIESIKNQMSDKHFYKQIEQ